jgi:hypothetical protein
MYFKSEFVVVFLHETLGYKWYGHKLLNSIGIDNFVKFA